MAKFCTHYDNLKITRNAPDAVVRAAYKALIQQYHPDKNQGSEQEALRITKIINQSFDVLISPNKRAAHDRWIDNYESKVNKYDYHADLGAASEVYEQYYRQKQGSYKTQAEAGARSSNQGDAKSGGHKGLFAQSCPRLLARLFDLWWEAVVFGTLLVLILSRFSEKFIDLYNESNSWLTFNIFFLPILLTIDAFLYRTFGNTPGKSMLGVKVRTIDGEPLVLNEYLRRNSLVWKTGLAFGIPLFNLYTMGKQAILILRGRQTSYDEANEFHVVAEPVGWMRKTSFVLAFTCLFFVQAVIMSLNKLPQHGLISEFNPLKAVKSEQAGNIDGQENKIRNCPDT